MSIINGNWFSIEEDKEVEFFINVNNDNGKNGNNENENEIEKRIKELDSCKEKIKELEKRIKELDSYKEKIKELETICNKISNENLKLINRVLEAEISIERTKNILLRKNISFPFTPLTSKFL